MRSLHLLIPLGTTVLLAGGAVARLTDTARSPAFAILAGMAFGQLALLAIWCVAGAGERLFRLLATLAIAGGLARVLAPATASTWAGWFAVLVAYWSTVSLTLWLVTNANLWSRHRRRPFRLQYSLGSILSLVTLLSVVLAMIHSGSVSGRQLASFAAVGLWLVTITLVTMRAIASARPGWMVTTMAAAVLAGVLLCRMTGLYDASYFSLLCLAHIATMSLGLLAVPPGHAVLRSEGQAA